MLENRRLWPSTTAAGDELPGACRRRVSANKGSRRGGERAPGMTSPALYQLSQHRRETGPSKRPGGHSGRSGDFAEGASFRMFEGWEAWMRIGSRGWCLTFSFARDTDRVFTPVTHPSKNDSPIEKNPAQQASSINGSPTPFTDVTDAPPAAGGRVGGAGSPSLHRVARRLLLVHIRPEFFLLQTFFVFVNGPAPHPCHRYHAIRTCCDDLQVQDPSSSPS